MVKAQRAVEREEDARQIELLEAALSVFMRFGFRKTSMDEVARAAHISRQGLYLRFKTKEELFKATVQHFLEGSLRRASSQLSDSTLTLEEQLVRAFDDIVGRFVGVMQSDAADLGEASQTLVGDMISEHEGSFMQAVAKCLRAGGLVTAYKPIGLSAQKLAETLYATARGLKHSVQTRDEFNERMSTAVRALCFPLRAGT